MRLFGALLSCALAAQVHSAPHAPSAAYHDIESRQGSGSVVSKEGLTFYNANLSSGTNGKYTPGAYTCFKGPASNFPPASKWMNFDALFKRQQKFGLTAIGETPEQQQYLYNSIVQISKAAKVDARVILSVVMLESSGNLSVQCTTSPGGVPNCGLMQSYDPVDKAFNPNMPQSSITQMIRDGTQGTPSGPGLVQLFNDASNTNQDTGGNAYNVFRAYNSGTVNPDNLSDGEGATPAYVSDMANYLQGWNGYGDGPSNCNFNVVTTTTTTTSTTSSTTATKSIDSSSESRATESPPTTTLAGTTSECYQWYVVKSGDYCYEIEQEFGITFDQFQSWNTNIDTACDNLQIGDSYCVNGVVAAATTTTTTTTTRSTSSSSGSSTTESPPTTTLPGTTSKCYEWYVVKSGDYCYEIEQEFGITFDQFQSWNTNIDTACDNLQIGDSYCVNGVVAAATSTTSSSPSKSTSKTVTSTKPTTVTKPASSTTTCMTSKPTTSKTSTSTQKFSSSTTTK